MIIRKRDGIEIILLAKAYQIEWWLREGYMNIAQQVDLTVEDLCGPHKPDWETISRIFALHSILTRRARERKNSRVMAQDLPILLSGKNFHKWIRPKLNGKYAVCRRASSG